MNVYLFLAFALGAITGRADAPASRCVLASVVAQRGSHAVAQRISEKRSQHQRSHRASSPAPSEKLVRLAERPMMGAASPRAPSFAL